MTLQEFTKMLNGRDYGRSMFSKEEIKIAKENDFVIVTGASDDLIEFRGAIEDEGDCFEGGNVYFTRDGVEHEGKTPNVIKALWCNETDDCGIIIPWTYETDIPHQTFDVIRDGRVYCKGIVFSIDNIREE